MLYLKCGTETRYNSKRHKTILYLILYIHNEEQQIYVGNDKK